MKIDIDNVVSRLRKGERLHDIAAKLGVKTPVLISLAPRRPGGDTTPRETVEAILRDLQHGRLTVEVAMMHGVCDMTVRRLRKLAITNGVPMPPGPRGRHLATVLGMLP